MTKEKVNKKVKDVNKKGKEVNKKSKENNKKGKGDNMKNKEINNKNGKVTKNNNVEAVDTFNIEDEFDMLSKQMEASEKKESQKEEVNVGDVLDDMQKNIQSQMNEKMQKELDALKEQILKDKQKEMNDFKARIAEETKSIVDTLLKSIEEQTKINETLKNENDKLKDEFNKTIEEIKAESNKEKEVIIEEAEVIEEVEPKKEEKKEVKKVKTKKVKIKEVIEDEEEDFEDEEEDFEDEEEDFEDEDDINLEIEMELENLDSYSSDTQVSKYIRYLVSNKDLFLRKLARGLDVNENHVQKLYNSATAGDGFWTMYSISEIFRVIKSKHGDVSDFIFETLSDDFNIDEDVSKIIVNAIVSLKNGNKIDKIKNKYIKDICKLYNIEYQDPCFDENILKVLVTIVYSVIKADKKKEKSNDISMYKIKREIRNHSTIATETVNHAYLKLRNKFIRMF